VDAAIDAAKELAGDWKPSSFEMWKWATGVFKKRESNW
jgi:hypothetical protein